MSTFNVFKRFFVVIIPLFLVTLRYSQINSLLECCSCRHIYTNISKQCNLCLNEKVLVLTCENQDELLNKPSELMCKCRHENKFLLSNYKSND